MRHEQFTCHELAAFVEKYGDYSSTASALELSIRTSIVQALTVSYFNERIFLMNLCRCDLSETIIQEIIFCFQRDLEDMPLLINDERDFVRFIASWRLEISK